MSLIYDNGVVNHGKILIEAMKRWSSHREHAEGVTDAPWRGDKQARRAPYNGSLLIHDLLFSG